MGSKCIEIDWKGLLKKSTLDRFPVYSGFSLDKFPVCSGFSLDRCPVYSWFNLDMFPVYSGFGLERLPVYSGFSFDRYHHSFYLINVTAMSLKLKLLLFTGK